MARIATNAWATGDPGVLFLDTINRANPTPAVGEIEATNPCGEVPLLPYEACNLASVNLNKMVVDVDGTPRIDWDKLARVVRDRFASWTMSSKWPNGRTRRSKQWSGAIEKWASV